MRAVRVSSRIGPLVILAVFGSAGFSTGVAAWAQPPDPVDYFEDVKPVLAARCFACHGPLKQESGLRLDAAPLFLEGGDSGPAVVPGRPAESLLLERVAAGEDERMPPEGEPLSPEEIDLLRRWIETGAPAPRDEPPAPDPRSHWSFRPPHRPLLEPTELEEWNHPVDALLARGLQRQGLVPLGEADRALLLRRVYLDLIGLPPTHEELRRFLEDPRPDAYERAVDRLLASPRYGERWGRHWMDVWRYSDWYGLGEQLRYSQKHIWHWRDWIVESLNEDRGYDRMVVEMLAADEVAPLDRDALRAGGFLARNYFLFNRTTWLDNTIEHSSKAFLGLTMNCSKCHDHKYDPITQVDYYRMRAVFEPHQVRLDPVPGESDLERNGLPRPFDAHPDAPTFMHVGGNEKQPDTDRPLQPGVPAFLDGVADFEVTTVTLPPEAYRPALQAFVLADQLAQAESGLQDARQALRDAEDAHRRSLSAAERGVELGAGEALVVESFDELRPDVWKVGPGEWQTKDGVLEQTRTGADRAWIELQQPYPADFEARLRFVTRGGDQWKSVGICFDVAGGREKMVYLSAVAPGSKLQVSLGNQGQHAYPADGRVDRPVSLDVPYDMVVRLRGSLVNVYLNGTPALGYELPRARESGSLQLIAFDAHAEFDAFELRELPAEAIMFAPGETGASPEQTAADLAVADWRVRVAERRPASLETAHAADRAVHHAAHRGEPDPVALQQEAAVAARALELAEAELALAEVERELEALDDESQRESVEKRREEAAEAVARARAAVEEPGLSYASIRASRKAPEGPDESQESQRAPFPPTSTGRRTALAQWMIDDQNPLTARVAVNHIWLRHFGQPLVDPVTDFGLRTPAPLQHELLDWLAVELVESGWSMKHVHRLVVTSAAYRRSSSIRDVNGDRDPTNEYYWRRLPVRMESQVIRDAMLHLGNGLRLSVGGPSLPAEQADVMRRRSLYFTHSRDDHHPFLRMFDDADILACYRRFESVIPQQALAMSNSRLALQAAEEITRRIERECGSPDDAAFVEQAFTRILAVAPSSRERGACLEALAALRNLLTEQGVADVSFRARRDLVHTLLNHNDFITIR